MPFGLTTAPSTFQALINEVFQDYMLKFFLVFFDDILVYSKSWSKHLHHFKTVLVVLRSHQLFVKKENVNLAKKRYNTSAI